MSFGIHVREEMVIETAACDASIGKKISLVPVALLSTCSQLQKAAAQALQVCFPGSFGKAFQMWQL